MLKRIALTALALSMTAAIAANQPSMPASSGDSQVKQVQEALKGKGQDPGPSDGKMGPKTQAALQSFQQAQGLPGSGQIDQQTLAALGLSGGASAAPSSPSTGSNQPAASTSEPSTTGSVPATSSNQPAASSNSTATPSNPSSSTSSNQPSTANQTSSSENQAVTKQ